MLISVHACVVFRLCSAAFGDVLWRDDFSQTLTYERWGPRCWKFADGELRFTAPATSARLIAKVRDLTDGTLRARLAPSARIGSTWAYAGLVLFADESNHWQLLVCEGPEGQRYFELVEKLNGTHQAQAASGTQLPMEESGDLKTWEPTREYELELSLTPEAIVGTAADLQSGRFWRRTYRLGTGRAVNHGRPGLTTTAMAGTFRQFVVEGPPEATQTTCELPSGRNGTVAILADAKGNLAVRWAEALEQQGFGVLSLTWDDLLRGPLPLASIDLLMLTDARRLPIEARDAVQEALRVSGKVIAIGAPAFNELVTHTGQGWVGADNYVQAIVENLRPVPLRIAPDAWKRVALHPERVSTIQPAPEEGADAWKLSIDLEGWDGFSADIRGAFGPDRSLLTFQARGDASTPQLSIEIREQDASRWIATVPLTPEWRTYALGPTDFPYWHDSPAHRGAPGDHLYPENAVSLTLGLSNSHTPKVPPGPHTVWIRALGTAPHPQGREPYFYLPEIQALSPSYMLFPLKTPIRFHAAREQGILPPDTAMTYRAEAYSPIWRERGRGFDRERGWRWIPILEVRDNNGRHRGALVSLAIGDAASPDAMWANVGVVNPEAALNNLTLKRAVLSTARAMARGCFLLEGGAPVFSCEPGETLTFGAKVLNAGKQAQELTVTLSGVAAARDPNQAPTMRSTLNLPPGRRGIVSWRLPVPAGQHTIRVELLLEGRIIDAITHELIAERRSRATPDDFVRVDGDQFTLKAKRWYFKGVNYRPTFTGGYPHLNFMEREVYDPEIIERDLSWMNSIGINAISAVHALMPPDPNGPHAYRDQVDFLDRCQRHGIKVFFFLPNARPFAGADPEWVKTYLTQAGIKDHPAVMCWELAWEPIHSPWNHGLDFVIEHWNRWVVQRYGSVENAFADWGYRPALTADGKLPVPTVEMATQHGEWDVMVAAFRRAWSDILSAEYRKVVRELRAFDPQHLISFRFGACGIPSGHAFAHAHSVGTLKHVDFMNPEGYSLMKGWTTVTPPDDWRKGGLVTLFYRHFSSEKPVVWMEFGYTVNGIFDAWAQSRVHIDPAQLQEQRAAYEALYAMFIESGARGAAPWWLPGGFRLGENSDFGILEPDGSERPACEVLRKYLPRFDSVRHDPPTDYIDLDLDAHYPDAWQIYSEQYLALVEAGKRPHVRTAGTRTTSADCPLTAVGNRPYNGHNPPLYLNAEFNTLEIRSDSGPWQSVADGETLQVATGAPVYCRASLGNLGEATWLAPKDEAPGGVFLTGRSEYGLEFSAPIAADTPFLQDANVPDFVLVPQAEGEITVSFEMMARGRAYFGERRTVTLKAVP